MNEWVGKARVGQWYRRADKGEMFFVTACDELTGAIEVQTFDGDLDEIDQSSWSNLPLELVSAPEDWTGASDVDLEDVDYSETQMSPSDWAEPLQSLRQGREAWEVSSPEDDQDPLGEGVVAEEPLADHPEASARAT